MSAADAIHCAMLIFSEKRKMLAVFGIMMLIEEKSVVRMNKTPLFSAIRQHMELENIAIPPITAQMSAGVVGKAAFAERNAGSDKSMHKRY